MEEAKSKIVHYLFNDLLAKARAKREQKEAQMAQITVPKI